MIISPPNTSAAENDTVVFLAGPIQGARDWQTELAKELLSSNPNLIVATPRAQSIKTKSFSYNAQVSWEQRHLKMAAFNKGVVVFWFEAQDHSLPYEKGRSYAQTTRFELGEVIGWKFLQPDIQLVIGVDPLYAKNGGGSEKYIRWLADEFGVQVQESLKDVVQVISRLCA